MHILGLCSIYGRPQPAERTYRVGPTRGLASACLRHPTPCTYSTSSSDRGYQFYHHSPLLCCMILYTCSVFAMWSIPRRLCYQDAYRYCKLFQLATITMHQQSKYLRNKTSRNLFEHIHDCLQMTERGKGLQLVLRFGMMYLPYVIQDYRKGLFPTCLHGGRLFQ